MSRQSSLLRLPTKSIAAALLVSAVCVVALGLASADPPKPSGAASAAELSAAAEEIVTSLEMKAGEPETERKGYALAILANAIADAEGDAKWKGNALAVRDAAIALAKAAKNQATVDKYLKEIKGLLDGGKASDAKPMKFSDIATLEQVMKEVKERDRPMTKNMRGANFAKAKDQIARDARVWAVLAAVARTDTKSAATAKKSQAEFEKIADDFFNTSKAFAAAVAKGDQNAAVDALKSVRASCSACHVVFRPDIE